MAIQSHNVTARDGLQLHLWEQLAFSADEAVLYVHGSSVCARALFAPPVPNDGSYSWLAGTTRSGREAFALDIRGYGQSELPEAMTEPPERNDPPVRADQAADDIEDAYRYIRNRYESIHLVGVAWGAVGCGRLVTRCSVDIDSLTLCAPVYRPPYDVEDGLSEMGIDPDFDAYYYQDRDALTERLSALDGDVNRVLFETMWKTQIESNQGVPNHGDERSSEVFIAPSGALCDYVSCCEDGAPFDAAAIRVPTLVIRGTADRFSRREDALRLYDELGGDTTYIEFAGGNHFLMHGRRRHDLFETVNAFHDRV